jgi:hypothetical protein
VQTDTTRLIRADTVRVALLATVITAAMAWPVIRHPATVVFGVESVGRHHDPFTFMRQLVEPQPLGVYSQPLTDIPASWLAAIAGPVAAYNAIVLVTFPLAALCAFLLGRHLTLSRTAAGAAALIFAFSPFHLAQAAYHPHIAQVQWLPLYLLALLKCLDLWSGGRALALVLATMAVVASNLYGGFIAAVITPIVVGAYWTGITRHQPKGRRSLVATTLTLLVVALCGVACLWTVAPQVLSDASPLAVRYTELFVYSAKWWAYLLPPIANPWFGDDVSAHWDRIGVDIGLLEQQVSLGIGVILLAVIALLVWFRSGRSVRARSVVPVLAVVAGTALLCSLSPERTIAGITTVRPSAWLYAMAPMFRAYARFGVVVQLMAAMLAGIALDAIWRRPRWGRLVSGVLLGLVAAEYAVSPLGLYRDVLPTSAHRWVMQQPDGARAIDCVARTQATESIPWLTAGRIDVLNGALEDCRTPNLAGWLAARDVRHLILRHDSEQAHPFNGRQLPSGFSEGPPLSDARVLEVSATVPEIYTDAMFGFSPLEAAEGRVWRWMGADATWAVFNTSTSTMPARLTVELQAFDIPRQLDVRLDEEPIALVHVAPERASYVLSFPRLTPGRHILRLRAIEPPTVADSVLGNGDARRLSVAVGQWTWRSEERP